MGEIPMEETWRLYRTALSERDQARAELDMLRLLTLELMRERDQAQTVARDCYEALQRFVRADGRAHRERWEEVDHLGDRLRHSGWPCGARAPSRARKRGNRARIPSEHRLRGAASRYRSPRRASGTSLRERNRRGA